MDLPAPTHFLPPMMVILVIFVIYSLAKRQRREKIEVIFAGTNERDLPERRNKDRSPVGR